MTDDKTTLGPRRRLSRRGALVVAALAVAAPGLALGAAVLVGTDEVEHSLPAGTLALAGTEPACEVVVQDVEYHCTLERPPAPEFPDWLGAVEPTVDATKHVNGGCRSLASDGLEWQCYIGEAAVEQEIVAADVLGQYAPEPAVG
jgi:hypothetical protein